MNFDPTKSGYPYSVSGAVSMTGNGCSNPEATIDDRPLHDPNENGIGNCAMKPVDPPIDDLYDHLKKVYHQKNHDYGNSFEDGLNEDGLIFAKMHLMEKYNRFKKLISEPNHVNGEGIRDSLLDMANYAIMTVYWMDRHPNQTLR